MVAPCPCWVQPWLDSVPDPWDGLLALPGGGAGRRRSPPSPTGALGGAPPLGGPPAGAPAHARGTGARPGFWAGLAWSCPSRWPACWRDRPASGRALPLLCPLERRTGAWSTARTPAAERWAAWAMGFAVSAALWPLLLLPLGAAGLLSRRARWRFYAQALFVPLVLALPWLCLNDPRAVALAWMGAPSTLGLPGALAALVVSAPSARPRRSCGRSCKPGSGGGAAGPRLPISSSACWRPVALLPGLALGAWTWALLAPQMTGAALCWRPWRSGALLVPGRFCPARRRRDSFILSWRAAARPCRACVPLQLLPLAGRLPRGTWRGLDAFRLAWAAVMACAWSLSGWRWNGSAGSGSLRGAPVALVWALLEMSIMRRT